MEESAHEQIAFGSDDFAENPEPRCPVVLLLDTSGSMRGPPIEQLNRGLVALMQELNADALAAKRVEIAAVTFGPVRVAHDFVGASAYVPPTLSAGGDTPMGGAILQGLELLRQRKALYEVNGIAFYRPWIFLMTDGAPTDSIDEARAMLREGEAGKAFSMFAVGMAGAKMDALARLSPARPPLRLDGLRFRDLCVAFELDAVDLPVDTGHQRPAGESDRGRRLGVGPVLRAAPPCPSPGGVWCARRWRGRRTG